MRQYFKSWTNSLSWHQKISKLASCFLVPSQKHTFLTFFTTRGQTRKSLILVIDFFHLHSITRSKNALKRCEFSILKCFFFTNKNLQTLPTSNDNRIKLIQSLQQSSLVDPQEDRMTNSFSDVKERDLQTPMSAGYLHKKTFFPPLAHKSRLMLRRSESERKLPAPVKYERGGGEPQLTGNIPVWYRSPTKPELHGYYIAKLNQLYYILVSRYL